MVGATRILGARPSFPVILTSPSCPKMGAGCLMLVDGPAYHKRHLEQMPNLPASPVRRLVVEATCPL